MKINTIKIVITYLVASLVWIMIGPFIVNGFSAWFAMQANDVEVVKGILFVLFTATVLYFTIIRQQRLLNISEKHYKSLFYANPTPLFICDQRSLQFVEVNTAAIEELGYSMNELKGMTFYDLLIDKKGFSGDHPSGDWQVMKKNKEIIVVHVNSNHMQGHSQHCILIMAEDITLDIQREETLKMLYATERELKEELEQNIRLIERSLEEKARLAEVIDRIHNIVMITDPNGVIIWVNRAFTTVTGYTFDEAVGRVPDFLHGPKTMKAPAELMNLIKKSDFSTFDILNYSKTGEQYWVGVTVSAVFNEQQEVIRYISVENVITDKKNIEERLRQQNEVLKKLAWTNSHAIRKPVVSILSLVELCKETFDVAELKKFNALVETCARELDDITQEVGKEINENDTIS